LTKYSKPMLDVILGGNKSEIAHRLALYKKQQVVQYGSLLAIPRSERIPALTTDIDGRMKVSAAISASLRSAFENLNLRVGMNPDQIVELAEQIIDQSSEDYLSLEDVLIFLQQLITGKVGKIYDRMDIPTFFELFEVHRQERHEKLVAIREEQVAQQRMYGDDGTRLSDNQSRKRELHRSAVGDYLKEKFKDGNK
jgi:hypothetical protein